MSQEDTQVIEVSVNINASSEKVWGVLTDIRSWPKWWGGFKLKKVQPFWKKGATLDWGKGRESVVFDFQPHKLLDFGRVDSFMEMEIHNYFKLTEESGTTKIVHGFSVKGADISDKSEVRQKDELKLKRLKETVEKGSKKWFQFWG